MWAPRGALRILMHRRRCWPCMARAARVAYQGERGAYSEEAALAFLTSLPTPRALEGVPCADFPDVAEAVERGAAPYGVLPVENSLEGNIDEATDLLAAVDLTVVGEVLLPIRHCLIARPGARPEGLRRAHSHPQALKQCRPFLRSRGLEAVPHVDTAGAVRWLAAHGKSGDAAIASERAAALHGMQVVARDLAAPLANSTRFFVVAPHGEPGPKRRGRAHKTSVAFAARHTPGALHACLGEFARRGVNLAKLESRPDRAKPWRYVFHVDVEGHVRDAPVGEALAALAQRASWFKLLGSYPAAKPPPR
jgi:prephenate dehydratase